MGLSSKFDRFNAEEKTNTGEIREDNRDIERYDTNSHSRNICFVETNGKQTFLNYSYLISGEFLPDENSITLTFTTHTVSLKGNNLEALFEGLMLNKAKRIKCIDKRYIDAIDSEEANISNIQIQKMN